MAVLAKENSTTFTPAPEGVHQAVCVDVVPTFDVTRKKPNGDEYKRDEVTIIFQLNKQNPDNDNKRFQVRRVFGLSLGEKSHLRPFLESWRGKKFSKEDLSNGFDVEKLIGVNCNIQIIHNGDYANIQGVMPLGDGQAKIAPEGYTRDKDKPKPAAEAEVSSLPPPQTAGELSDEDIPF